MSGFTSFAVWGAGNLGKQLVTELLSYKKINPEIRVTVLARPESIDSDKNADLAVKGAMVIPWDPSSPNASDSLTGIDVFICSASGRAAPFQIPAAHAAAKAGVKLFVPNDWGSDIFAGQTPWHKAQQAAHQAAKEANIAVTSFFCGFWPDVLFRFGYDLEHGKIDISGDGNTPMSLTSVHDVARFAAYALVNLSKDKVVGRNFKIQGDYPTPLELAEELKAASTKSIEVVHTSIEELQAMHADGQAKGDFMQVLIAGFRLAFATGGSQLKGDLDNDLWPEWKPTRAVDVLKRELLGEERYISDAGARAPVTQAERDIASK